jgi:hypothetical protein
LQARDSKADFSVKSWGEEHNGTGTIRIRQAFMGVDNTVRHVLTNQLFVNHHGAEVKTATDLPRAFSERRSAKPLHDTIPRAY